jgi:ankyrin repeat protein
MSDSREALVGEFIDAVVSDRARANALLTSHPDLLNARWIHHETVLHFLAVEGFTDGVRFLAERGADVNAVNEFGDAPLIDAAMLGNTEIAEVLLRHGANPDVISRTNDNPLHTAARKGNVRLVALLLDAGADARYETDLGESVFDAAAESDDPETLIELLQKHGMMPGE